LAIAASPFHPIEVSVPQQIYHHTFANGLTLLAERMEHVRSSAFNFLVPAGCVYDPLPRAGVATVLAEMITRGAGSRDSRELAFALDNLGLDRGESVGSMHTRFWGSTLARSLPAALEIYADILRRPHLPEEELDPVKELALQDLHGLEDEPGSKVMVELRKRFYPAPLSNDHRGTPEGIEPLTIKEIKQHHLQLFNPRGTILSVAGFIEWDALREQVERLFGDWQGGGDKPLAFVTAPDKHAHLEKELEQTQIALAYPSVPVGHPDYYAALGAVNVLSGGMSSRLFTEIREKEGLCYSVGATYQTLKDRAGVVCYAASLNDMAQRTLDLLFQELRKLPQGVTEEEMQRVRVGLKTSLIMQQESTGARAGSLASDWYYLGRVRSFDEIQSAVDSLTPAVIGGHLRRYPPTDFCVVVLGPQPLSFAA
jgi:predicted Zn-dependent peptidase